MIATRRRTLAALVLLAPCGLLTHRALEAQIAPHGTVTVTFNVPVQLASLDPKFTQVTVLCAVDTSKTQTATQQPAPDMDAKGTATITNGAFSGTVPLQLTIPASSGQSFGYVCRFSLLDSATNKNWVMGGPDGSLPPAAEGALQRLAQPGTAASYERRGSFTVQ